MSNQLEDLTSIFRTPLISNDTTLLLPSSSPFYNEFISSNLILLNDKENISSPLSKDEPVSKKPKKGIKRKRKEKSNDLEISSTSSESPASSPSSSLSSPLSSSSSTSTQSSFNCKYSSCMICPLSKETTFSVTWKDILILCFRSIQKSDPQKGEWLHVPSDIFIFMEEHLEQLWSSGRKQVENWKKRIHDTLCHNRDYFESGKDLTPEKKGYWALGQSVSNLEGTLNFKQKRPRKIKKKVTPTKSTPSIHKESTPTRSRTKSHSTRGIGNYINSPLPVIDAEELESELNEEDTSSEENFFPDEDDIQSPPPPTHVPSSPQVPSNIFVPTWRQVEDYEEIMETLPQFEMPDEYIKTNTDPTAIYKELHEELEPRRAFWEKLNGFLSTINSEIRTYPHIGPFPVDLYKLYALVSSYGGYNAISSQNNQPVSWSKEWEEIFCKIVTHKGPDFDPLTNESLPIGDPRWRRPKLKQIYELYLLQFEQANNSSPPSQFLLPEICESKSNYVRCLCGHSHWGATPDVECETCKLELEKVKCEVDHVQCEACGAWQHIQCLLDEYFLEESELLLLQDKDFHFYCEMCTESCSKRTCVVFPKKVLQFELPLNWTCERKWTGSRAVKNYDFLFFDPGNQLTGHKGKHAIKTQVELVEILQNINKKT